MLSDKRGNTIGMLAMSPASLEGRHVSELLSREHPEPLSDADETSQAVKGDEAIRLVTRDEGDRVIVSYQIVLRHGGEPSVESDPERGTCFRVELPAPAKTTRAERGLATLGGSYSRGKQSRVPILFCHYRRAAVRRITRAGRNRLRRSHRARRLQRRGVRRVELPPEGRFAVRVRIRSGRAPLLEDLRTW